MGTNDKKYKLILADPPWTYSNVRTGGSLSSGSSQHYTTMTLDEIKNLSFVKNNVDDNAVCFLWTTTPLAQEGFEVLKSWGFCVGTGTRILTRDLQWVKAETLKVGDKLLAFDDIGIPNRRGNGNNRRYYRESVVLSTGIEIADTWEITLEDGRTVTCTPNHRWLGRTNHGGSSMEWIETSQLPKHLNHKCRTKPVELCEFFPISDITSSAYSLKRLRVIDATPVGPRPIVTLQTSTGTYIAGGLGAHNTYKTKITWVKTGKLGMGFWLRGQTEDCLVGVRGNIKPFRSSARNVIIAPRREHSRKPDEIYWIIEPIAAQFDLNPKCELFARGAVREGWSFWGLESNGKRVE